MVPQCGRAAGNYSISRRRGRDGKAGCSTGTTTKLTSVSIPQQDAVVTIDKFDDTVERRLAEAAVTIFVPDFPGANRGACGAGVLLDSGEIVTATHVLVDELGRARDVRELVINSVKTGQQEKPFQFGGSLQGNLGYDTCWLQPSQWDVHKGLHVAADAPVTNDAITALLLSNARGGLNVFSHGKVLGLSYDGRFLAISGHSIPGDSGGPVIDSKGNLIGIIVSGGSNIGMPFQAWKEPMGYQVRWEGLVPVYQGDYILCARPYR